MEKMGFLLAIFRQWWYNVRNKNTRSSFMVTKIVAAQFYFSNYYFFSQKK